MPTYRTKALDNNRQKTEDDDDTCANVLLHQKMLNIQIRGIYLVLYYNKDIQFSHLKPMFHF